MNSLEDELKALSAEIEAAPENADAYFRRGRILWKMERFGAAISDYETAASIAPDSPAVQALEIAREIMDFYHKDRYNP